MEDESFAQNASLELDTETRATRECIERIPETLWEYKPHEKSMKLGYLVELVAEIPMWISYTITEGDIDLATYPRKKIGTTAQLLKKFDQNIDAAKRALAAVKKGDLDVPFSLKSNGEVLFTTTKKASIEQDINHMIHHRGQLTVYMRLNEIAVPSIYGPSADTKGF